MMYVGWLKRILLAMVLTFAIPVLAAPAGATDSASCECPTLGCDPCSFQKSITFYASKCGPNQSKVKSCARPTCLPLDEATKECPVLPKDTAAREPIVLKAAGATATESDFVAAPQEIGKVKVLKGSVSIVHADGKTSTSTSDVVLKEKDRLAVNSAGGAVVEFKGGNKLQVQGGAEVEVKEYSRDSEETKRVMLNLLRGKIRSQVKEKYNGQTSYYKITTKSAVAGVRGTDFVIEEGSGITRVETLEGKVNLANSKGESVMVPKGMGAAIESGELKPVYKMTEERLKQLDSDSDLERALTVAAHRDDGDRVCKNPSAAFNMCAWKCSNNPEGEKRCRTDLPKVSCQRTRCNANGDWADAVNLPANHGDDCPAQGASVKNCDY
jgi:hypothetical protein